MPIPYLCYHKLVAATKALFAFVVGLARWKSRRGRTASPLLRIFGVAGLEGFEHGGVGEGGDVAESPAGGDVAQEPPHNLSAAGLGQVGGENDALGPGQRADFFH